MSRRAMGGYSAAALKTTVRSSRRRVMQTIISRFSAGTAGGSYSIRQRPTMCSLRTTTFISSGSGAERPRMSHRRRGRMRGTRFGWRTSSSIRRLRRPSSLARPESGGQRTTAPHGHPCRLPSTAARFPRLKLRQPILGGCSLAPSTAASFGASTVGTPGVRTSPAPRSRAT